MMKKLAIIQSGGGIKCMFGAGILDYLATLSLRPDMLISGSASAVPSDYFLASQHQEYLKKFIVNGEYTIANDIKISNLFSPGKGYIPVDDIINTLKIEPFKLNVKNIIKSKTDFIIPSLNSHTGELIYLSKNEQVKNNENVDSGSIIFDMLKASVAIQFLYKLNPKVWIDDQPYCDSYLSSCPEAHIPYAINSGVEKILIIENSSTKLSLEPRTSPELLFKLWQKAKSFKRREFYANYAKQLEFALNYQPPSNVEIYRMRPDKDLNLKINSKNVAKITFAYNLGRNQASFDEELSNFLKK